MGTRIYKNDLSDDVVFDDEIAVDTEAMGLNLFRDRLCLVQICDMANNVHIVQFDGLDYSAPNLRRVFSDANLLKIFHYARFDASIISSTLGVYPEPLYCTKIASKICRTYSSSHSLRDLCNDLLDVRLNKQKQCSNWGSPNLTKAQISYAAADVLHLHNLKDILDGMLRESNRADLANDCFRALKTIVKLDVGGWSGAALFEHGYQP